MATNYSRKSTPVSADLSVIWDSENSDYRLATLSSIATLIDSLNTPGVKEPNTQYSAPALTGFDVVIRQDDEDTHLVLTPTATLADGTISLPEIKYLRDKQLLMVNTTQQITTLTINFNDAISVNGGPTTLGADDFFTLKYDAVMNNWNRIA